MMHTLAVSALCAAAAFLAERVLAASGRPRRLAWIAGMVLSVAIPLAALLPAGISAPAPHAVDVAAPLAGSAVSIYRIEMPTLPSMPRAPLRETVLLAAWIGASAAVFLIYTFTALRLNRRARNWANFDLAQGNVLIANDLGPAVLGLIRPRIVFPRWLIAAPAVTQRLALAHEQQHVAARDPLLLAAALTLVALLPWNLPLLWQLRRLRFALEVDCDARVLARGTDAEEYGEALLAVSQRATRAPAGSVALIERTSQLERRINIMIATPRVSALAATLCLALGASCLLAATKLETPALADYAAPLKPTPAAGSSSKLGYKFEELLASRYPRLFEANNVETPVITVLFNEDGTIEKSSQTTVPQKIEKIEATREMFASLGLTPDAVPYVGVMGMRSPTDPAKSVLMLFTERATPGKRFVSHVAPDTSEVDREIYWLYFPAAVKNGVRAGEAPWVLLDRAGHVLRSGQEPVDASGWNRTLENRYPGIRTEGITVTPLIDDKGEAIADRAGKGLQLHSVWLAPGSPPPTT